jgi:hypothetical protein
MSWATASVLLHAGELKDTRYSQRLDRTSVDRGQVMQVTGDNIDAVQAVTAP